jgi:hypothetical protein
MSLCSSRISTDPCVGAAKTLALWKRCGDHLVAAYLAKINAMKRQFLHLAATGRN